VSRSAPLHFPSLCITLYSLCDSNIGSLLTILLKNVFPVRARDNVVVVIVVTVVVVVVVVVVKDVTFA
jgi:ABC-type Mn2+/Zn2+ transport system permease subunit